jgi:hypothetical protein
VSALSVATANPTGLHSQGAAQSAGEVRSLRHCVIGQRPVAERLRQALTLVPPALSAGAVIELTGGAGDIRALRNAILLGLPVLIACLATAGLTGQRLAGGSRSAIVRRKQRRLQAAAAAGLLVLVPCALILSHLAAAPAAGGAPAALEITESVVGAVSLSLLALNARDGRRMTRRRRTASPARLTGSQASAPDGQ